MVDWISLGSVAAAAALFAVLWRRQAAVTQATVVVSFLVFLVALVTAANLRSANLLGSPLLASLAFRPDYLVEPASWWRLPSLLTTMFLHFDVVHIVANMVMLVFIGLPFEERVGRARWLFVFLVGGILGTLLHSAFGLAQGAGHVAVVGASGAFFAVLACFATLYPRDPVVLFAILIFPRAPVYLAAIVYSGLQFFALVGRADPGVAVLAHVGGAIAGFGLAPLVSRSMARAPGRAAGPRFDLALLDRVARTADQRAHLAKLRENLDEPELAAAWAEKLVASLRCGTCGGAVGLERGRPLCENGHPLGTEDAEPGPPPPA